MSSPALHAANMLVESLAQDIDAPGDLDRTLRQIVQAAQQLFAADMCTIFAVDPLTRRSFWPPIIAGALLQPTSPHFAPPRPDGITRRVLDQQSIFVDDMAAEPECQSSFTAHEAIRSFAALALRTPRHSRPLAVLYINFRSRHAFDDDEQALARLFAHQAATILQTTWFLRRYGEVARIGQEINQEVESARSLFEKLQAHVSGILDTSYFFMLAVYQPQTDRCDLYMVEEGQYREHRNVALAGASRWVVENGQRLIIQHLSAEKDRLRAQLIEIPNAMQDQQSLIFIPLVLRDVALGALSVQHPQPYAYDDEDVRVLELLGNQVALAFSNIELLRLRLLRQAGDELGEIADLSQLDQAYAIVTRIAYAASRSQVVIRRYDPDTQELRIVHKIDDHPIAPPPRIMFGEGLNGRVAQQRATIVVPDVERLPEGLQVLRPSPLVRSLLVTPVQFRDEYYGNLALIHQEANHFLDADVAPFEGLAAQLGLTIHRLEAIRAQQEGEQRIKEAETMSSIGQAGVELAHRLGNDLGPVRSLVNQIKRELSRTGIDNPAITKKLNQITQDVGKILSLSGELKGALGGLREELAEPGELTDICVRELLSDAAGSVPELAKTIRVVIAIADGTGQVRGVYKQVADILRNLFLNAIEAMPQGGPITLRARNAGMFVEIQVEDRGVGIAPAHVAQIFALFYSTKGRSGFGLWSARRNALANGGDLQVESHVGQGTIFTFSLPRVL